MEINEKLDAVIKERLDDIETMDISSDKTTTAIKNVSELHRLRMEEKKAIAEVSESESKLSLEKGKLEVETRKARGTLIVGLAGLGVTVAMNILNTLNVDIFALIGMGFEQENAFVMNTSKKLYDGVFRKNHEKR